VIDHRASRFEDVVKQVDLVFDTVGGETLERSWSVLAPGGRVVTVSTATVSKDDRKKAAFFIVEPNQKQLTEVARLLDNGQIRTELDVVVALSQAPDAYAGKVARRGRGKLVVTISQEGESR
jgi:NADPH:quinone reductase-like Zn-dependent oxidoreductase